METVDISIVVCTYNRAKMLRGALGSLIGQETDGRFSYEIVVIDDGSTDDTGGVVKEVAERSQVSVRYVYNNGSGIAEARNKGVIEARGGWIAFFDDDQLAEKDWLKNLFEIALQTGADCVGGTRLLDLPEEELSRLGPVSREILGEYVWQEESCVYRGKKHPATGSILVNRSVFDSLGLFDTSLLGGGEDYDLVNRMCTAGYDIWSAPNAVVRHLIPRYRLELAFFRWSSLRRGATHALINHKQFGRGKTLFLCIARIGQALLINVPFLLLAYLRRDRVEAIDRKCLLWQAAGYTRRTVHLLAPEMFPQEGFFSRIEFRKERFSIAEFQGSLRKGKIDT